MDEGVAEDKHWLALAYVGGARALTYDMIPTNLSRVQISASSAQSNVS